ncbi:hypothetical protein [Ketogulonicigenium vulgare]|uniref:hypothetical protein n=1 Tax=Ketogulonicigenium vulgare TaxID=92945 RepID=UPI0001E66B57|nr:hypothetical protein [Ketogulonicigenium vulgare]ADO42969.1 hypothetical protein EIO_1853 [Ketogulonicigenium vulgare Y25]ALJ81296.1 hypothetical protein KVH_08945 [Ketogulonicigenium vulgare]ANW34032.1 hypothetical protein KvSKV_08900 [Ketogulonicigenium vulgare]AOZ54879.1 hypothetical protein KVC_1872 [Ketogulonicigenium vulgare]
MTTIYDAAKHSFVSAANMLAALQESRIELLGEARAQLEDRPKLKLAQGYNDIGQVLGTCLPPGGQAELSASETGDALELRCSNAGWMTLEAKMQNRAIPSEYYVELGIDAKQPVVADVFIREFLTDGTTNDVGHREVRITDTIAICRLSAADLSEDATAHRVIVHVRQPASRMIIDRLAVTLI